ncbi:hypothetical protein FACS1894116_11490 [Betaproteobacteria bacterium]|nr:hypothetical protein FACS1894116_11490 [Betaproteobacteria bacterium]
MMEFLSKAVYPLTNPGARDFWAAWQVVGWLLVAIAGGALSLAKWIGNGRKAKIERVLTFALVQDYLDWVKVHSKSQVVGLHTLKEWLSKGNVALLGYDYSVFRNFVKRLRACGGDVTLPDEMWFHAVGDTFRSTPKWSRCEW